MPPEAVEKSYVNISNYFSLNYFSKILYEKTAEIIKENNLIAEKINQLIIKINDSEGGNS